MKKYFAGLILGAITLLSQFAVASPLPSPSTFYFDVSNDLASITSPPGFGSILIEDKTDGIYFTVSANTTFFTPDGNKGLQWDKFYFNARSGISIAANDVVVTTGGTWSFVEDKNVSSFGIFQFGEEGNSRGLTDPLSFYIKGSALTIDDFVVKFDDYYFAGHLRNFADKYNVDGENVNSTFLAVSDINTPVPEPGTIVLLGVGLLGLGLYGRKREK